MKIKHWISKKLDNWLLDKIEKSNAGEIYTGDYGNEYHCYQCGYRSETNFPNGFHDEIKILKCFHSLFIHFNFVPLMKRCLFKSGVWSGKIIE